MKTRLTSIGSNFLRQITYALQQHPRRLAALVGSALFAAGSGAWAIAAFGPDAADIPVRQVLQSITPLSDRAPDTSAHSFRLFRTETLRSSDSADTLLQRLGIVDPEAAAFLRSDAQALQGLRRSGSTVFAEASNTQQLLQLSMRWASDNTALFQRLVVEKTASGWSSRIELAPLVARQRLASASIRSSLFAATDEAGIPDAVASQLAEIFANNIDFRHALRTGDRLSLVYETLEADFEPLRTGRVLSAEFVNNGKTFDAVWFQDQGQPGRYYSLDGRSTQHSFLAAPLAFSRVTSGFAMRLHPIHQTWRAHLGTDFAAPSGTPVRSVGHGRVSFAGVQNGYGNVVFIDHGKQQVTVYAHLSQIDVRVGDTVDQAQTIGAVGMTGWATGPHLHFEFRLNGVQQDPQTIAQQGPTTELTAAARPAFDALARSMLVQLSAAAQIQQASAE